MDGNRAVSGMPGHPRLFWSADEVAGLRAKAAHPKMAAVRADVLARCARYADPDDPAHIRTTLNRTELVGVTPGCGHTWQKLPDLILAALLTDEPCWIDLLAAVLRVMTQDSAPIRAWIFAHAPVTHHDRSLLDGGPQRNLASQCGMIPLMLDFLWDRLPAPDRAAACAYLEREIVEPYLAFALDASGEPAYASKLGINLGWWEFYSWLWSLAVVYDGANERHRLGMAAALRSVRMGLHLGVDEAGVVGEGAGYAAIEIFNWWTAAEIFRRFGLADMWKEDERFRAVMDARIHQQYPGDRGIVDHGDTARSGGWHLAMLLHSLRTGEPAFQGAWERMGAQLKLEPRPGPHQPLGVLGYWLWNDPAIVAADARPRTWVPAREAGRFGLHTMRTGWDDDALFFAFFAAGRSPGCIIHQHSDAGHFALAALGEEFTAGRGYGHTRAEYHNVLRVEGREPPLAPLVANSQSWRGGHTLAAGNAGGCRTVLADLAWQWGCCWYERRALLVDLPGSDPYVLLVDHCNPANDWARFDWQFQVEAGHEVDLDAAGRRAVVCGRQARLELSFACLAAGEYAKPGELDLILETRRHIYAEVAENHPHASGETYRCLIARLSAYCGVILAALTPRRRDQAPARSRVLHAPRQCGLVIEHGEVTDTIVANPQTRRLALGGIEGEAALVVARRDRAGRLRAVCAADCFELAVDGRPVQAPCGRPTVILDRAWP